MKSELYKKKKNVYSSNRQLYCCDITYIGRVPSERATCKKNYETFEKSYLLTGLSKFAQTFAVRFLKSSSIHPICINAWGNFSFNMSICSLATLILMPIYSFTCFIHLNEICICICFIKYLSSHALSHECDQII